MNRITLDLYDKVQTSDSTGRAKTSFNKVSSFASDYVVPFGDLSAKKEYGFDISTTHRTFTRETVKQNQYIGYKDKMFHVIQVVAYPNDVSVLLLELV